MTKNRKLRTALIIGRWQPWHKGHRELFKAALDRAERVAIGVRSTHATDEKNPFTFKEVSKFIDDDLSEEFPGKYEIIDLPNITNVIYGRDVGYKVEKISENVKDNAYALGIFPGVPLRVLHKSWVVSTHMGL